MRALVALLALLVPATALAHPPRGIVAAPDGRVFFSDLQRVWMIDPNGRASVIRRANGGHTHELFLGHDGALFGEDSHYANGSYTSALWRHDPDGRIAFLFGPAPNPPAGLGVVRDRRGCTYQSDKDRGGARVLYRRCGARSVRLSGIAAPRRDLLSNISGATVGPDGFYFREGRTVRRVDAAGRVSLVATGLSAENFGLAIGTDRSVYVAEFANRRVVRVEPNGRRSIVTVSPPAWGPTGVAVAGKAVYVLESTPNGSTRIRVRRLADGHSRVIAVVP